MFRSITLALCVVSGSELAAETLKINDPTSSIEIYALYGAARICADSDKLSLVQRFKMGEIREHFSEVRFNSGIASNNGLAFDAAAEMFGIRINPTYDQCANALLQK